MSSDRKTHWETVYQTKSPEQVSWTQEIPKTSLRLIYDLHPEKSAAIIDIGGGDSKLVDHLLDEGYTNITVLDISAAAIDRAKQRLGERAKSVQWIVSDINDFKPEQTYSIWHDRAAFHFLTDTSEISNYVNVVKNAVSGNLILGTFSKEGPKKCSGLDITQYDANSIAILFNDTFKVLECFTEDHTTPFDTVQNFLFCQFRRKTD